MSAMRSRTAPATSAASEPFDGRLVERAARRARATVPGRTIRFGISLCSRSVRVTTTRIQQKTAEMSAVAVSPKARPHAPPSRPVASVTSEEQRGARRRREQRAPLRNASGSSSAGRRTGAFVATRSASGPTSEPGEKADQTGAEVHATGFRAWPFPPSWALRAERGTLIPLRGDAPDRNRPCDEALRPSPITRSRDRGHSF